MLKFGRYRSRSLRGETVMHHRDDQPAKRIRSWWLSGFLVGLALVSASIVIFTMPNPAASQISSELFGTWKTSSPSYADRLIEITESELRIGTGGGDVARYPIRKMSRRAANAGDLYTIEYSADRHVQSLSLYFSNVRQPEIRLKNKRDVVWQKEPPRPRAP